MLDSESGNQSPDPLATPSQHPPSETSPPSFFARFFRLFTSPGTVFALPRSTTLWVAPLIILCLLQMAQAILLHDLIQQKSIAVLSANDHLSEEQKEKMIDQMRVAQENTGVFIGQQVGGLVTVLIFTYLVPALLYLLGLNFVLGARARFSEVFSVVIFTGLIYIPKELLRIPLILAKHSLEVFTSPAAFVPADSFLLRFVCNLFDIFDLYRLFLLAAGFAVITQLPIRKTAYPVVAVWLLWAIAGIGCMLSPVGQFMR
jgi:hypothetical protein